MESEPVAAAELLDEASEQLAQGLDQLRELARGIHPALLTDRGLKAALAKYAEPEGVSVTVERTATGLAVEISDDGCGGADPAAGTGLRGLADRVAALGGRLRIDSPPGAGTRIRAELALR